jgi:dTDP-4-dehydrorhamnose 3,5-epimerase
VRVFDTALPDVKLVEPETFEDERGFFYESWNARTYAGAGIDAVFVQDNHSRSARGVLRGLHYQMACPQGKLVRVVSGLAFTVAVDIRRSSPRFGQWVGTHLSAKSRKQFWVPAGFAHAFLTLEDDTDFLYKCTDFHAPEHERAILWSDPILAIDWPLGDLQPLLSAKDAAAPLLADAETFE